MDFKEFLFEGDDMENMWRFVIKNWDKVFNVSYIDNPEPGDVTGWHVRVCRHAVDDPVSK